MRWFDCVFTLPYQPAISKYPRARIPAKKTLSMCLHAGTGG